MCGISHRNEIDFIKICRRYSQVTKPKPLVTYVYSSSIFVPIKLSCIRVFAYWDNANIGTCKILNYHDLIKFSYSNSIKVRKVSLIRV